MRRQIQRFPPPSITKERTRSSRDSCFQFRGRYQDPRFFDHLKPSSFRRPLTSEPRSVFEIKVPTDGVLDLHRLFTDCGSSTGAAFASSSGARRCGVTGSVQPRAVRTQEPRGSSQRLETGGSSMRQCLTTVQRPQPVLLRAASGSASRNNLHLPPSAPLRRDLRNARCLGRKFHPPEIRGIRCVRGHENGDGLVPVVGAHRDALSININSSVK